MKKRIQYVVGMAVAIFLLGLGYAGWIWETGIAIPCFFHEITGLQCPGCGVTRLCLALLQLDFIGAWKANAGLLCLSPVLIWAIAQRVIRYVKMGESLKKPKKDPLLSISVVYLVAWGIGRNFLA